MATRFGTLGTQFFDGAGDPLVDGKIYVYESGTTTPKDTYTDPALTIKNTNPIILTAEGRLPLGVWFDGVVKMILTESDDTQVQVIDPVGLSNGAGALGDWNSTDIYAAGDTVTGPDGAYYVSITNGNQANNPTTSPVNWTQFYLLKLWNTNESYNAGDPVVASNGAFYTSIAGSNLGNDPSSTSGFWLDVVPATLENKTLVDPTLQGSFTEETFTITASALDPANGTIQTKTITANTTFTDSLVDGQSITLHLIDADLFTVVFPAASWIGGSPPATFTGDDFYELWKIDSTLYAVEVGAV